MVALGKPKYFGWDTKHRCINCNAPVMEGKDFCSEECKKNFLGSD